MRFDGQSPATSLSGMCEVTRAFHSLSSTLNSLAGVFEPEHFGGERDLVVIFGRASRIACLLNGVKQTASTWRSRPSASARR